MDRKYYQISEDAARRAKAANSFSDYVPGSATEGYRAAVDHAAELAEAQKARVDEEYHAKIDSLLDTYARKLAANINRQNEVDARVPSVLIAGGSNFPVKAKARQNAARDNVMAEYNEIQKILDRIRSTGMGGIMSDDKNAIAKLTKKLNALEWLQARMKAANAAVRMKDTAKGDARLEEMGYTPEEIKALRSPDFCGRIGYPSYQLSNNNANIRRIRGRIEQLQKEADRAAAGAGAEEVRGEGYTLRENRDAGRIQFIFDGKPDADTRTMLKANGFHWAPSAGAWQRMLNDNGRAAARRVCKAISQE